MTSQNSLVIDPDQQVKIEALAAERTCSPEFIVRDAIDQYFSTHPLKNAVKLSEEELAELDASWEHYQRTGLHVTLEEVDTWLARLQAGERVPPPECHL